MTCPKCGAARPAGAAECPECGVIYARFEQRQESQQQQDTPEKEQVNKRLIGCPACGKSISAMALTCPQCGQPLRKPAADNYLQVTAEYDAKRRRDLKQAGWVALAFIVLILLACLFGK